MEKHILNAVIYRIIKSFSNMEAAEISTTSLAPFFTKLKEGGWDLAKPQLE